MVLDNTWEEEVNTPFYVSHPGAGLDKRYFTIQLIFRMNGQQPITEFIFCGHGKKIKYKEKESDTDVVRVYC